MYSLSRFQQFRFSPPMPKALEGILRSRFALFFAYAKKSADSKADGYVDAPDDGEYSENVLYINISEA